MTGNWGGSGGCRREKKTGSKMGGRAGGGLVVVEGWRCSLYEEQWASKGKAAREGWREGAREAVIKSDCIASRMSQESRISGDVKPCLTPQLDNCGCGS